MASLNFQVQSMSSAGPERVNIALVQVNDNGDPSQPFYGANLSLNLSQADADAYDVNQVYTLTLTKASATS